MPAVLFMLLVYLIFQGLVIGFGVGVGFLLHWLLPRVDLGTAILIGVVSTGFCIHYYLRFLAFLEAYPLDDAAGVTIRRLGPVVPRRRRRRNSGD